MRARHHPARAALSDASRTLDYAALLGSADRIAADLQARGVTRGARIAILSENRIEYTLVQIACAKLGAIVACQNWRLAPAELSHCLALVDPLLVVVSPRFRTIAEEVAGALPLLDIGALGADGDVSHAAQAEDGLLIIYTSGTTGLPKAATISHRAEIARMSALRMDLRIEPEDGYVAWAPMFHMGGTEHLLAALMSGAHGTVIDGFDADAICDVVARERIGWLMLVPATVGPLIARLRARAIRPVGVKAVGCMADLVPDTEVAEIAALLDAPYLNSFGATETGMPPLSGGLLAAEARGGSLDKQPSSLMELRLVGPDGRDVNDGQPGEAWVRGPTLFSGYWAAPEANADSFRDGWFRMGDLFRRTQHGYAFVGRSKYLIKSGGENIYPAEIERVLLADPRVADAIVVRRADARWGEVPVAVIARNDDSLDAAAVEALCRAQLASYKRPRDVRFVDLAALPRSASGKIVREAVESMIA
ncbi:MAG: long-chain fatty acid--CoA ligase [Sphingomonadales bacterium]|nr:MAG: long-chain fatty acid--CoA ligase [Sphingomonadales bacterium]